MSKALAVLALTLAAVWLTAAAQSDYPWTVPPGVAPPPAPVGNPMQTIKVALGRRLFYDADLSADGTMSCGTCHEQSHAFGDAQKTRGGVTGQAGRRNAMSLTNVGYYHVLTWGDPGLTTLESQALVPIAGEHPVEMGMAGKAEALPERLGSDGCYPQLFAAAFPEDHGRIDLTTVAKALAAFERTLVSRDSPYDRFQRGDHAALPESAARGMALFFGKALDCAGCHAAPLFTDAGGAVRSAGFHNIGLYDLDGAGAYPANDHGLREITGQARDEGRFRTPTLRNAAVSAPYMHDGSVPTLTEAIERHYAGEGPLRDPQLRRGAANASQTTDLIAFLNALTDQGFLTDPKLSLPKPGCPIP